ncbi:WASH complex subunit FAM21A, partial [Asbolus verrucosus]
MSTNKPWERPWSMEEIIDNSDKWSLAGDVALLNTLKSFADNLLSKTTEINNNLHNLTNNLEETSLQLNIAQNEFQSLRNSQFIESRVYEDDETLPQVENVEKVEEKTEINHTEDIRLAALKGLKVLDHYFDKIEVSVSDSEDDDIDLPNYVLRPKDLYLDRPLPYVIGSEEWHKSLHVGLEVSSSDSETENVSDKFSESDSESDLQAIQDRSQIKETSDTSSEFDFLQKIENKQVKQDLFQSSDSEDQNSIPVQAPISNKNFAEELATKLGNVINQEVVEPEINRRPIQTKSHYGNCIHKKKSKLKWQRFPGDLFFDEPPPLDENKGLFSGGSGLFDDDDDDDAQYSTPTESKIEESPKLSKPTSLFDDSDDDIFGGKKQFLQSSKPPLISEEPPVLQEKKKPVGGVSIFGNTNLFDKKLLKRQPSSGDEEEDTKESKTGKKIDLFDDGDLFKEAKSVNKSENIPTKKINLFDSDDEDRRDDGYIKPKETKKISLFDDDDDLFKDDLFSANTTTTTTKKFGSGLFDDIDTHDDLFETKTESKPSRNLFDDLMSTPDNKNSINSDTKIDKKDERNVAVVSGESSGGSKPPVH